MCGIIIGSRLANIKLFNHPFHAELSIDASDTAIIFSEPFIPVILFGKYLFMHAVGIFFHLLVGMHIEKSERDIESYLFYYSSSQVLLKLHLSSLFCNTKLLQQPNATPFMT